MSEATIAAELYMRAIGRGLRCALEVPIKTGLGPYMEGKIRADVAFADDEGIVYALVEIKRQSRKGAKYLCKKQRSGYEATGIPWRYCHGMDEVGETLAWAETHGRCTES